MRSSPSLLMLIPALAAIVVVGGAVHAQLEGGDRGIPPIDSTSSFEVTGVEVDVTAADANAARLEGWRRAQALGWRMLWSRTNGRPASEAPALSESALNGIVSGIVIEQEQIGPTRYVARLGVLFDRARTGQMLGVEGLRRRSAAMLVIPVMQTGGGFDSFESRSEWQAAWARFRTANSPIDYVRPSGSGIDPLLLNEMQAGRRGRGWWRVLLDQYGAADVVVPEVRVQRLYPGGPALATFSARHGPDNRLLARFQLRAENSAAIPAMLDEGVRRLDMAYAQALAGGALQPDPTLIIERPAPPPAIVEDAPDVPVATAAPPTAAQTSFSVQVATPDAGAVQQAELSVSRAPGVTSALTTSLALGGTSVMRVTYMGDAAAFEGALRAQGWQVERLGGNALRISR